MKRKLTRFALTMMVALLVVAAPAAGKALTKHSGESKAHYSLRVTEQRYVRLYAKQRGAYVFWKNHKALYAPNRALQAVTQVQCRGAWMPRSVCWRFRESIRTRWKLERTRALIAALEAREEQARLRARAAAVCGGTTGNRAVGCILGFQHGWDTAGEWSMVDFIITRESHWNTAAQNPSGACGLGQMIGGCAHSDVVGQFYDFIAYIGSHYHGSLSAAYSFWLTHHWY